MFILTILIVAPFTVFWRYWYDLRVIYVVRKWTNKLFSEENKAFRTLLKLETLQGRPDINKVKQYEIMLSFKVSLFIQFVYSVYSVIKTKQACLFN